MRESLTNTVTIIKAAFERFRRDPDGPVGPVARAAMSGEFSLKTAYRLVEAQEVRQGLPAGTLRPAFEEASLRIALAHRPHSSI